MSSTKSATACHSPRSSSAKGFLPTRSECDVRSHLRNSASLFVIIRSRATRSKYPSASWSESASGVLLTACLVRPSQSASWLTLTPNSCATRTAERFPFGSRKSAVAPRTAFTLSSGLGRASATVGVARCGLRPALSVPVVPRSTSSTRTKSRSTWRFFSRSCASSKPNSAPPAPLGSVFVFARS